ncbi:DUF2795 domain-containing protein [Arsukibacterium sp.]|uniref:DUF2795 domain-containing protein n=1 Tax=Arsukibacterium sp. TaxID=1977258 RepID=UPI00299F3CC2|nr:DUF2795 domain-containing protein [Arsukibacterium sp.]MDX1537450.1 DUF2795 domain-containing protein [Arsukibacterium sp.]
MTAKLEQGDIYFFYRSKIDSKQVNSIDDVQRFHLVMVPDNDDKARLFVVGKKRLPEISDGSSKSTQREWMLNYLTASPQQIGKELGPLEYQTSTEGEREQGEAIPAGAGRYLMFEHHDSTRLAYRLYQPDKPGKAQQELGILAEASFVISVRNPEIDVPGFPDEKPDYPQQLKDKFADKRWIDISDTRLLDYENAQLLLIGAHDDLADTDADTEADISGKPALFDTLGLKPKNWPDAAIEEGKFTTPDFKLDSKSPRGDPTKGGRHGGKAALESASAAGIAQALKGIDFPRDRDQVVKFAEKHNASAEIIDVLQELPERKFNTMADLEKAVGEVR